MLNSAMLRFRVAGLYALLALLPTPGVAAQNPKNIDIFDIMKAPSAAEWRHFLNAPAGERQRLWTYFQNQRKTLRSWSWGWRLAWIRSCYGDVASHCDSVLTQGLADPALVVRAEAAAQIGRRYRNTGRRDVVQLLATAYANKANYRWNKPLYVQQRILHSLKAIGSDYAQATAMQLATTDKLAYNYWQMLNRM